MFECNWLEDLETVVKNKNDFTLTFDKWAGFLFVDNSNAFTYRVTGHNTSMPCKKISEEEADTFIKANTH